MRTVGLKVHVCPGTLLLAITEVAVFVAILLNGVAFISILNSGLLNLGLTDAYYQVYKGAALLAVLSAQILLRRRIAQDVRRRQEHERLLAEARGYA